MEFVAESLNDLFTFGTRETVILRRKSKNDVAVVTVETKVVETPIETWTDLKTFVVVYTPDCTPKGVVIVLHGLGGCVDHWEEAKSSYGVTFAGSGLIVIAFDFFSHGKSSTLPDDLLYNRPPITILVHQLHSIINHAELPCRNFATFTLQMFSMGCFVGLNYISASTSKDSYLPPVAHTSPVIDSLIIQSPWSAMLQCPESCLLHIPCIPHFARHTIFSNCHTTSHLWQFLFKLKIASKSFESNADDIINQSSIKSILLLAGDSEGEFFTNARDIYVRLLEKMDLLEGSEVQIQFKSCPNAGHMSFCTDRDGEVGHFFRSSICDFLAKCYFIPEDVITNDLILPAQCSPSPTQSMDSSNDPLISLSPMSPISKPQNDFIEK